MPNRTRDDPYGLSSVLEPPTSTPVSGFSPMTVLSGETPSADTSTPIFRDADAARTSIPTPTTTATPAASTASPLNTLYGVDSESYLTDDQRKMMRMIQGQFDASMNRRDRELARYGAPMLANYANDEALARAIAQAQALNYKEPVVPGPREPVGGISRAGGGGGSGGGSPRIPNLPDYDTAPRPTSASTAAKWQQIASGLMSVAPLLFGKAGWSAIMDKGILGSLKELFFGKDVAPYVPNAQLEAVISQYGDPYSATSGWGQDVVSPSYDYGTTVDTGSGWDYTYGPQPDYGWVEPTAADWGVDALNPGWEGGDWGGGWWDTPADLADWFG